MVRAEVWQPGLFTLQGRWRGGLQEAGFKLHNLLHHLRGGQQRQKSGFCLRGQDGQKWLRPRQGAPCTFCKEMQGKFSHVAPTSLSP